MLIWCLWQQVNLNQKYVIASVRSFVNNKIYRLLERTLKSVNANLYAVLRQGFPTETSRVAIQTPTTTYSWEDLEQRSAQYAQALMLLQLEPGDRMAVQVEKSPEALILYLACLRAGLVYLPLNNAYTANELAYFLENAEPSLLVVDPQNVEAVTPVLQRVGTPHMLTLDAQGQGSLAELAAEQDKEFRTRESQPDDLAAILYTSGTTGRSKGAMLTHENLASNARVLHDFWGWNSDDVLLHMLPLFHVHGLFVASHGALLAGAKTIWLPKLDIDQAIQYLPETTIMMGVPTYYVRLLADERFQKSVCPRMRLFVSGSAPLLLDTFEQFEQRMGQSILERYGMSETVMLTSNPYDEYLGKRVGGTVGMPLPGVDVRIMDETNQEIHQVGQVGGVQVRGPNVFVGYWQMPEKTAEEFTADGWFCTGDLGQWTQVGGAQPYVSIVGRSKDLIITGGYNVYPKEIELLIDEQAGVLESAVIGVPDADFGEAVHAVVVVKPDSQLDLDHLHKQLVGSLAKFKQPKKIHVVAQLPRNTMGKVQKNILREQYSVTTVRA